MVTVQLKNCMNISPSLVNEPKWHENSQNISKFFMSSPKNIR